METSGQLWPVSPNGSASSWMVCGHKQTAAARRAGYDAFAIAAGVATPVTSSDLSEMDAIGWDLSAGNPNPGNPSPTVSPDGSTLVPGSGGSLMTSAGTWTFSMAIDAGGNDILLNGNTVGAAELEG
jgi:hypothetical protein